MKISECLIGDGIILVPYLEEHVPKYHEWMQSTYLQDMTESEPLTLQEEYEMQQSWTCDDNKLTFIILDFTTVNTLENNTINSTINNGESLVEKLKTELNNMIENRLLFTTNMCGDVNLFLHSYYDEEEKRAEIEVMIAEENSRRKGIAQKAVQLMMEFGNYKLGLENFEAKILDSNLPSLALFEKKLNYKKIKYQQVFSEWLFEFNYKNDDEDGRKFIKHLQSI